MIYFDRIEVVNFLIQSAGELLLPTSLSELGLGSDLLWEMAAPVVL